MHSNKNISDTATMGNSSIDKEMTFGSGLLNYDN